MSNNILVNWKVNTDEVAKSRDVLNQANTAANKFQQTAKDGAKTSKDAFAQLVAEEKRLENAIKGTTRTAFTSYAAFAKQLQGLSRQYADVKIKVEQATKAIREQEKAQQDLNKNTKSLATNFGNLYSSIRTVIAAGFLREVVSTTLEMAKLSGTIDGVERAFARLPNSELLLNQLRQATHGTVTDLNLMQKALTATNFRIPLTSLGTLLEFAAVKAQQTGQEVNHLVDFIVSGIGLRSIKRLDDLGFTANRVKAALGGVTLQAASMEKVMSAVTQLMNEDLQKTGGFVDTTATKVDMFTVSWEKLRAEVSKRLTGEGGAVDFMNDVIKGWTALLQGQKAFKLEFLSGQALKDVQMFVDSLSKLDQNSKIEETQQKLNSLVQIVGRYNDEIRDVQRTIDLGKGFGFPGFSEENQAGAARYNELVQQYGKRAKEVFESEIADARLRLQAWVDNKRVVQLSIPLLKEYLQTFKEVPIVAERLGLIEKKLDEIEQKRLAINTAQSEQAIHDLSVDLEKLNSELADLQAFGTTKRQLIVNGQLKLVPVLAPKGSEGKLSSTKTIDFSKQLQDMVDDIIASGILTIPIALKPSDQAITPMTDSERIGQEFADNWKSILSQGISDTTNFLDSVVQAEADSYDQRLNQTRAYYDEQVMLAGDNERAKDELRIKGFRQEQKLRREAFEADKRAKKASAAINGAAGIINAFATLPYPAAVVAAALIAAETVAQIAVIDRQRPKFAKGVIDLKGPGTKTSDSINAKLSKGESVMTADETGSARGILNDIRAGKLNDKKLARQLDSAVLRDLKITKDGIKMVGMDDSRIVKKLDQLMNTQPDYMEKSGVLWKTKQKSENYKKWVRAKIM